jgi:hypothetical protein
MLRSHTDLAACLAADKWYWSHRIADWTGFLIVVCNSPRPTLEQLPPCSVISSERSRRGFVPIFTFCALACDELCHRRDKRTLWNMMEPNYDAVHSHMVA